MASTYRKYVHKQNNRWAVQKTINGKLKTFKSFANINEAIHYRDRLIENNWQTIKPTEEEQLEEETRKYYRRVIRNHYKTSYRVVSKSNSQYLGTVQTIEEALYYRDLFSNCPLPVPKPQDVDLITDNPYLIDGLRYPLPERLRKREGESKYGKGTIQQRSKTSYRVVYNKERFATCRTYEQAYYVRMELQKCNWDKNEVDRILRDYPKWYTWLMKFYKYIHHNNGKYYVNYPREYSDGKIERIIYNRVEDALFERDYLMNNGWDYEELVYTINDEENPYYTMELPPYPQRKIRNLSNINGHVKELNTIRDLILEGVDNQKDVADAMGTLVINIRNWLKPYHIDWRDFRLLVLSGEDIWSVLELEEHYYTPDLSPSKPSNYSGYVHRTRSKRSPYCVSRKGEYYGAYKDKKTARRVVNELKKVNWDKNYLKKIQEKIGHESFLYSKKWVYNCNKGKSFTIRKKDKDRNMINYGTYRCLKLAERVRDLLIECDWDKTRLDDVKVAAMEQMISEVKSMSCVFCTHYIGMKRECCKGRFIENLSESFDCEEYEYNGELKVIDDD